MEVFAFILSYAAQRVLTGVHMTPADVTCALNAALRGTASRRVGEAAAFQGTVVFGRRWASGSHQFQALKTSLWLENFCGQNLSGTKVSWLMRTRGIRVESTWGTQALSAAPQTPRPRAHWAGGRAGHRFTVGCL